MPRIHNNRKLVTAALAAVVLGLIWAVVFKPALDRIATLNRVIPQKQQDLDELIQKADQYNRLAQALDAAEQNTGPGSDSIELLLSIEQLAEDARLGSKLSVAKRPGSPVSERYSRDIIEIELSSITMQQMLMFLNSIGESDSYFQLENLRLRPASDSGQINASLHLSAISL